MLAQEEMLGNYKEGTPHVCTYIRANVSLHCYQVHSKGIYFYFYSHMCAFFNAPYSKMEKYFSISKASFIKMTFSLNVFVLVCNIIYFPRRLLGDYFI